MKPPKNRRNQRSVRNRGKLFTKGTGIATPRQNIAVAQVRIRVFLVLYPPNLVMMLPPTTTPSTGPVMVTIPKDVNTTDSLCSSSVIM